MLSHPCVGLFIAPAMSVLKKVIKESAKERQSINGFRNPWLISHQHYSVTNKTAVHITSNGDSLIRPFSF